MHTTLVMKKFLEHFWTHTQHFIQNQPDEMRGFRLGIIEERIKIVKQSFLHSVFAHADSGYGLQQTFMPSLVYQEFVSVYYYYCKVIRT